MKDRIVFFGCSVTYGHGLPDCIVGEVDPGNTHSNLGYAKIVGDMLGKEVINRSLPGSANMRILNRILEFDFLPTDTVFIQWSIFDRSGLFSSDRGSHENILEIRPWMKQDIAVNFYNLHTEYDLCHRSMFDIHHANLFLEKRVDSVTNVVLVNSIEYALDKCIDIPDWFNITLDYWAAKDITIDLADDGSHPGLKSQEYMAELSIDLIRKT